MRAEKTETVNCPSCGATLVAGLRFCRMCGYRLGEGVEEYVATQRFDASSMPPMAPPAPAPGTDPFAPRQTWGMPTVQPIQPFGVTSALNAQQPAVSGWAKSCVRKAGGWWLWLTIAIVLLVAGGMIPLSMMTRGGGGAGGRGVVATRSFLGVDGFETAPGGGALVTGIAGPETPVVRAGLIGGDIIKSFDGRPVRNDDAMREILGSTPVGKTVPVDYVRDGVPATTTLTTTAQKDTPGLRLFDRRPGGRGVVGINVGDRVRLPNSEIYGVELDDVDRNGPADLAGLKEHDIIVKFGEYLIRTPGDLRYRIAEALPGTTVPVAVVRGAEQVVIPVKIGKSRD
ncbi:MAG TPA: PDZ domain-containing protein [Pyrinomonadaceae bacterium]|jgi:membrane-associated protease RseP (regulator of RpoE activity)